MVEDDNTHEKKSAIDLLSSQDRRRLYFSTSSTDNFSVNSPLSPQKMVECKGENFCDIHEMGKKSQKYLKYQPSQASFWQRTNCKYTEEFHPLPLGDYEINKQLAATFRPESIANQPGVKVCGATTFRDSYQGYEEKKMIFAKGKNFAPENARHTRDDSKLTVMEPHSHTSFLDHRGRFYPDSFAPKNQSHIPDPRLFTDWRTRYREVFNRELPKGPRTGLADCSEDNSFRINGGSVPNKVRDFFNMRRAFSAEQIATGGSESPTHHNYNQGPPIVDILKMSNKEIKSRAESISEPKTSGPASEIGGTELPVVDAPKASNKKNATISTAATGGETGKRKKSSQKSRK